MYGLRLSRPPRARWLAALAPAACALGIVVAPAANAALSTVGPVDPDTGYPTFFGDSTGLRLAQCLDQSGNCLAVFPDPGAPASFPDNFPDESFFWDGSADLAIPGPQGATAGKALFISAVEGAFATEVAAGDQIGFQRIRLRIVGGFPNQDYTFTHPYGTKKIRTDAGGKATDTVDIGCLTPECTDYSPVLRGAVGPFLKWTGLPNPPAGYIGDPNVLHKVTGSPTGTNFVRVNGGGNTGLPQPSGTNPGGITTDLFSIQGKLDTGPAPPPPAPTRSLAISPTTLPTFGSRDTGTSSTPQNVNVTNTGNQPVTFASIAMAGAGAADYTKGAPTNANPACGTTLAAGTTCAVSVAFSPKSAGSHPASLRFTDDAPSAGSVQDVGVNGTGTVAPIPQASLTPDPVAYGNQNVGTTSAAKAATLTNTGGAPLNVSDIATTAGYTRVNTGAAGACTTTTSLAPGGTCAIDMTFTPAADGPANGTLTVTDNAAAGTTQSVSLTGSGVTPAPTAPTATVSPVSMAFGPTNVGAASATQNATLSNGGTAPLTIGNVALTGVNAADFTMTNGCGPTLAAGASCTVAVAFKPLTAGTGKSALLRFTDNAGNTVGSTQDVALGGNATTPPATTPGISVTPTALTFTARAPGLFGLGATTQSKAVTVTSSGTANMTVGAPSIGAAAANSAPGDYAVTGNTCTGLRAPGTTCTITVRFGPRARGTRRAVLSIPSNATTAPTQVALSGTGT
jgi:hypothetical protein